MAEHQDVWPISVLWEVLEVSRSGCYTYLHRQKTSVIDVADGALVARVKAMAAQTHHRYGRRRMAQQLQHEGSAVGRYKARWLMHEAGLCVRRRQRPPRTTDRRQGYAVAPKLLARRPCPFV